MTEAKNIHPFDVYAILNEVTDRIASVEKIKETGVHPVGELIRLKGKLYRQTTSVMPETEVGKEMLREHPGCINLNVSN